MPIYNEFCIFSKLKCWYMISLQKLIFLQGFSYVLRWSSCLVHQPWFYSFQVTVYLLFLHFSGETICLIGFVIVRKRERDKRKNGVWTYLCMNVFILIIKIKFSINTNIYFLIFNSICFSLVNSGFIHVYKFFYTCMYVYTCMCTYINTVCICTLFYFFLLVFHHCNRWNSQTVPE